MATRHGAIGCRRARSAPHCRCGWATPLPVPRSRTYDRPWTPVSGRRWRSGSGSRPSSSPVETSPAPPSCDAAGAAVRQPPAPHRTTARARQEGSVAGPDPRRAQASMCAFSVSRNPFRAVIEAGQSVAGVDVMSQNYCQRRTAIQGIIAPLLPSENLHAASFFQTLHAAPRSHQD